jgi:multiple sugar transport system substrate-binding protein
VSTTFFDQYGGGLLTPDYKRSALDRPESLAAVRAMTDLFDKYKVSPPPAGNDGMMGFETGKVAMAIQGIWMINELNQQESLNYAAAPVPFFGPIKATWANSHCLCMPATASDERKQAGFEFIKYLSDHSLTWAKGGQVPVRKSILESKEFQALPVQSQFAKQLPYATYEPFSVTDNQISTFADSAVEGALNHVEDPKEALDTAARRVNNVLSRQ